jgi:hypothetical protein
MANGSEVLADLIKDGDKKAPVAPEKAAGAKPDDKAKPEKPDKGAKDEPEAKDIGSLAMKAAIKEVNAAQTSGKGLGEAIATMLRIHGRKSSSN